jgi:hypothetical protein
VRFQSLGQRRRRIHEAGGVVPGRGNTTGYFIIFATCSHVNTLSFGLLDLSVVSSLVRLEIQKGLWCAKTLVVCTWYGAFALASSSTHLALLFNF